MKSDKSFLSPEQNKLKEIWSTVRQLCRRKTAENLTYSSNFLSEKEEFSVLHY